MHSTLSENVEGSPFKQDLDRCEMFSSWTEGPFLKMGNVVFGAGSQVKSDMQNDGIQTTNINNSPQMNPTQPHTTNITDSSDTPLTIQFGGGQAAAPSKQGGRTASKSRSNPKKRTSKPKKKTTKKK